MSSVPTTLPIRLAYWSRPVARPSERRSDETSACATGKAAPNNPTGTPITNMGVASPNSKRSRRDLPKKPKPNPSELNQL